MGIVYIVTRQKLSALHYVWLLWSLKAIRVSFLRTVNPGFVKIDVRLNQSKQFDYIIDAPALHCTALHCTSRTVVWGGEKAEAKPVHDL